MHTIYKNHLCYVTSDDELVLATMKDYVFDITPVEIDIPDSIMRLLLVENTLVIHTTQDDVYVYDIVTKESRYVGKYYIKILSWYILEGIMYFIFATTSHFEVFNENFTETSSFKIPENEYLEKSHFFLITPNILHYVTVFSSN